jgi:hypothetical protein
MTSRFHAALPKAHLGLEETVTRHGRSRRQRATLREYGPAPAPPKLAELMGEAALALMDA